MRDAHRIRDGWQLTSNRNAFHEREQRGRWAQYMTARALVAVGKELRAKPRRAQSDLQGAGARASRADCATDASRNATRGRHPCARRVHIRAPAPSPPLAPTPRSRRYASGCSRLYSSRDSGLIRHVLRGPRPPMRIISDILALFVVIILRIELAHARSGSCRVGASVPLPAPISSITPPSTSAHARIALPACRLRCALRAAENQSIPRRYEHHQRRCRFARISVQTTASSPAREIRRALSG